MGSFGILLVTITCIALSHTTEAITCLAYREKPAESIVACYASCIYHGCEGGRCDGETCRCQNCNIQNQQVEGFNLNGAVDVGDDDGVSIKNLQLALAAVVMVVAISVSVSIIARAICNRRRRSVEYMSIATGQDDMENPNTSTPLLSQQDAKQKEDEQVITAFKSQQICIGLLASILILVLLLSCCAASSPIPAGTTIQSEINPMKNIQVAVAQTAANEATLQNGESGCSVMCLNGDRCGITCPVGHGSSCLCTYPLEGNKAMCSCSA